METEPEWGSPWQPDKDKPEEIEEYDFNPMYPSSGYAINRTRTASFFSVRRFVKKNHKQQIATIMRYKECRNQDFIDMVAGDLYAFLVSMFGSLNGYTITNLSPGNSKGNEFHLATEIGLSLAGKLGIPHVLMFLPYYKKNHNVCDQTNKQRLVMSDVDMPDRIILIDDVATTGTSMESAMNRLKSRSSMIIPVVWVYGEVKIG